MTLDEHMTVMRRHYRTVVGQAIAHRGMSDAGLLAAVTSACVAATEQLRWFGASEYVMERHFRWRDYR